MSYSELKKERVLSSDSFIPCYQPVFDLCSRRVVGCEILPSWLTAESDITDWSAFIAEGSHLRQLSDLISSIFTSLLADIKKTGMTFREDFFVILRVLPEMFRHPDSMLLLESLPGKMEHRVRIVLDIAEQSGSLLINDTMDRVRLLCDKGYLISVGDYGAGYTSGIFLATGTPAFIRTDIRVMEGKEPSALKTFLRETARVAGMTGTRVIVQGVDSDEQEKMLCESGITCVQGYRYGPPVPFNLFCYQSKPWSHE